MSSKKMLTAIIIMAVLLLFAVVCYLLVDRMKQKEEDEVRAENASLQLFSFDTDTVESVSFEMEEGNFRIGAADGEWSVSETDYPYVFTLNTYYITAVVNYMSDLTALQKFTIEPERLGAYGLDDPVKVTCDQGGNSYTLYVGNASVTEEYWYVMVPGSDLVYGIDYNEGEVLRGGTQYLKSRYIVDYYDVYITGFKLEKGKDTIVDLTKESGLWEIKAPTVGTRADSAQVGSLITSLTRIEVSSFAEFAEDAAVLKKYGLDKPAYTLTVSTDDKTAILLFAPTPENDGSMYILNKETGQISVMDASAAGFLNLQPEELLNKQLLDQPFNEARSLDVRVDDLTFTMEMDASAGIYKLDSADLSGKSENVTGLYKNLYDTVANLTIESLVPDAQIPDDAEPSCEFHFTMADGSETVLSLIESNEENIYWAVLNGEYTGLTIRRRSLTSNTGVLNFYEKLTDALAEET